MCTKQHKKYVTRYQRDVDSTLTQYMNINNNEYMNNIEYLRLIPDCYTIFNGRSISTLIYLNNELSRHLRDTLRCNVASISIVVSLLRCFVSSKCCG